MSYDKEEEELFPPIPLEISYASVVIVDCIPVIPKEKEPKLMGLLKKLFEQFGAVTEIFMPFYNNESQGFAFVHYEEEESAKQAVEKLNNYRLDKNHVFIVNRYEDFELYSRVSEVFQPPVEETFDTDNLHEWLLDEQGRDQFVLRYGDETEVMWHVPGSIPRQDTKRNKWSDSFVSWSPRGTYLVTYHKLGVILWGGNSWKKVRRFRHTGVALVDFSPNEKYLITYSPEQDNNKEDPESLAIWDVVSGQRVRGFVKFSGPHVWPEFHWSHDDKYFSRIHKGLIGVYETQSMTLLDKKPIELHGPAMDHAWSPTDNYLSAFVPENQSIPAKVVLMEIPSKKIVGQQALFNVVGCRTHWQEEGKFLAVKVDRHAKSKKQTFTSFEFFRVKGQKDIPVEHLELEDNVIAFAWEPKGSKFAIIHDADSQTSTRPNVSIYDMGTKKLEKKVTLERRPANHLYWSPMGRHLVLAGLKSLNGKLEFYDAHTSTTMAGEKEHPMCTDVCWDPTGRFVVTWVSSYKSKSENGYRIWPFHGHNITFSLTRDPFYQFLWRPRPPSLLTKELLADIDKKFKDYQKKYAKEDKEKDKAKKDAEELERHQVRTAFRQILAKKKKEWEDDAQWRKQQLGIEPEKPSDYFFVEELVEEVTQQPVGGNSSAAGSTTTTTKTTTGGQ